VPRTDLRLAAYAAVDEANSALGVAVALGSLPADVVRVVTQVQNDLFDVGADLCTPVVPDPQYPPLRVTDDYVEWLEAQIDHFNAPLPRLRSFILPGGTPGAALLHVARTLARRAERDTWAALQAHASDMTLLPARYLNRLSDLLFVLARVANPDGDVLWQPGGDRQHPPERSSSPSRPAG
jgi:cob(I)alamin adenosyltransferase